MIIEQRTRGAAVLYISTELDEILAVSDRIAVMYGGKVLGIVRTAEADLKKIGMMMAGLSA
ncbi:MAG: hypothetical protein NUW23_00130 [Firmicutes bacterium]|nr:hypothetical protein [Bacillota bacterium]